MEQEIQVARDKAQLCRIAAQYFLQIAESAVRDHGRFTVALSGGNTPRALYELLAAEYANKIPWDKVHIFFGDERQVPSDHPDSNHRMANEALLSRVAIPAQNVHRVRTELGPESAALDYENQLRAIF
ncbi:MAG TPA: 6-phosphogluconolactonase, partial [Candidatus Sulfotelmatobacter sp.]|nr:6-phosphogluconolactonase [Candidatus Sulfotelmatobacter sp.]